MKKFVRRVTVMKNELKDCAKEIAIQRSRIRYIEREIARLKRLPDNNNKLTLDRIKSMIESSLNFYEARNDLFSSRLNRTVTLSGEIRERIERFKNSSYEIRTALYPSDLIFRGIPRRLKVENFIIVNDVNLRGPYCRLNSIYPLQPPCTIM